MTVRRVEVHGISFTFYVDDETRDVRRVHVVVDEPTHYEQSFDLPPGVDPQSYATGWSQARYRDVAHLL